MPTSCCRSPPSLLMTIGLFALNMSYGFFVESRSKRELTERFGEYVPPELVDEMARDPAKYSMEGKDEVLTVLFTDIRGFTSIAEGLDPKALSAFMNEFLTAMSLVIRAHRGTLDKYVGDQIMAFWGAPVSDAQHARQAVAAALAMQVELAKLNERFKARGWPQVQIGVGINTGPMSVGDMGSKLRKAYTVMGDAVNLASRLESLTKRYGVGILVGHTTREAIGRRLPRDRPRPGRRQGRIGDHLRTAGARGGDREGASGGVEAVGAGPEGLSLAGLGASGPGALQSAATLCRGATLYLLLSASYAVSCRSTAARLGRRDDIRHKVIGQGRRTG